MNLFLYLDFWALTVTLGLCVLAAALYLREGTQHSPRNFADLVQTGTLLVAAVYLINTLANLSDPSLLGPRFAFMINVVLYGCFIKIGTQMFLLLSLYEHPPKDQKV